MPVVIAVVIVVAVLGVVLWLFKKGMGARADVLDPATDRDRGAPTTVRYPVEEGQDPAVLIADLRKVGHEVEVDTAEGRTQTLVISCEDPGDRTRIRRVLAASRTALDDGVPRELAVRFEDERVR